MSITPHEIESQELGCDRAFGHTVIMGLGMGWIAANVAMREEVTRVTVIELDPDVIALIDGMDCFATLPGDARAKVHIVHGDALQWRPATAGDAVDFLFADIWLTLDEQTTVDEVRRMQANIGACSIYFWGQEMALYRVLENQKRNVKDVSSDELRSIVDAILGLPLLIPEGLDYAAMIDAVVTRRRTRGLYPPAWAVK
jgi:spermidine synthase